ncbi:MAG: hypothetical protein R2801_06020 [Chitinophagales bacterium]
MGQSQIRKLLYMYWSNKKLNKACIAMYEKRLLLQKGKAEKSSKNSNS